MVSIRRVSCGAEWYRARRIRLGDGAAFRQRYGLGGQRVILFVGRLNPIGPGPLLYAFRREAGRLADCSLVFVG
jgi:hypothetical protein